MQYLPGNLIGWSRNIMQASLLWRMLEALALGNEQNCPLCRVEFEEAEEPTLLNCVNKKIDDVFNSMSSAMKQERQEKRQEFLRMKRPAPREPEQPRQFNNLEDFLQFVISNNGAVTRNGDGSVRVTLPQTYNS